MSAISLELSPRNANSHKLPRITQRERRPCLHALVHMLLYRMPCCLESTITCTKVAISLSLETPIKGSTRTQHHPIVSSSLEILIKGCHIHYHNKRLHEFMKSMQKVHLPIPLQAHTRWSNCNNRNQPYLNTNSSLNRRESWEVVCCGSRLSMLMIKYTLREHCLTNASLLLSNAVGLLSASHGGFLLVAWGVSAYPEKWFYRRSLYSKSTVMHVGLERVCEVSVGDERE